MMSQDEAIGLLLTILNSLDRKQGTSKKLKVLLWDPYVYDLDTNIQWLKLIHLQN